MTARNRQPRLFADTWPWDPAPPGRPPCYRCGKPGLADSHDPLIVWCAACGSTEPRLTPEREAELRAEVKPRPYSRRESRVPSKGDPDDHVSISDDGSTTPPEVGFLT